MADPNKNQLITSDEQEDNYLQPLKDLKASKNFQAEKTIESTEGANEGKDANEAVASENAGDD